MEIKCDLIKVGIPTVNGHIYTEEALRKLVGQTSKVFVLDRREEDSDFGELDLSKVVGEIETLRVVDGALVCDVRLINGFQFDPEVMEFHPTIIGEVDEREFVDVECIMNWNVTKKP